MKCWCQFALCILPLEQIASEEFGQSPCLIGSQTFMHHWHTLYSTHSATPDNWYFFTSCTDSEISSLSQACLLQASSVIAKNCTSSPMHVNLRFQVNSLSRHIGMLESLLAVFTRDVKTITRKPVSNRFPFMTSPPTIDLFVCLSSTNFQQLPHFSFIRNTTQVTLAERTQ